jgi:hypothetical protein
MHDVEYETAASVMITTMTTSLSYTSFNSMETREPRIHNNQHQLPPTLNNWGAETEPHSKINEYVLSIPTKSSTPSLTHTRMKLTHDWSTRKVEDMTLTTPSIYLMCPTPDNSVIGTGDRTNEDRDSSKHMPYDLKNQYSETDTPVAYSVLVDMPQDFNNNKIFHSVVPKNKPTNYVQKTETGRWYERHIILPTKTESSTTGNSTLPTQTSEETCTITGEDTKDY